MYLVALLLLFVLLPLASTFFSAESAHDATRLIDFFVKWFVFWVVGIRLLLAGAMQVVRPGFTAAKFFKVQDDAVHPIVREIGFGNLAMGTLGVLTLAFPNWLVPAALAGGLYYGLAGLGHLTRGDLNFDSVVALVTDFAAFFILGYIVLSGIAGA